MCLAPGLEPATPRSRVKHSTTEPLRSRTLLIVGRFNGGAYVSAHVLLDLLNELRKRDNIRGLPSIFSLFRNEFNKFNNTRARMLYSIYHMTLRLL